MSFQDSLVILAASVVEISCGETDKQTDRRTHKRCAQSPTHARDYGRHW